jgi:ribose transport system substrate-binding protein
MKIPNSILMPLAAVLMALPLACRKESPAVAIIPRTTATLLWEPMHLGAAETARAKEIQIYWNAPADEGDSERQLSILKSCAAAKYRGIIFAPDETLDSRSVVLDLVRRRIPVVLVDDELGPPAGPFLSYVSNDEAEGAQLAARRVAFILHGHGSIAIIGISPRSESGVSREEAFEKALSQAAPGVQIGDRRFGDTVVAHQQQIAQQILHAPDRIDAIVALTATATRGAYYARTASEPHSSVPIVGFDQDALLPLRSGDVDSVVVQNTRTIGQTAMSNLDAQMRGEKTPPLTLVAPLLMTRETVDSPGIRWLWQFADYSWERQGTEQQGTGPQ